MAAATSNIALIEHVNINVSIDCADTCQTFFVDGLGCVEDPRVEEMGKQGRLFWFNAGVTQFHVPLIDSKKQKDVAPQIFGGVIGLACPSIDAMMLRLEAVRGSLAGTKFEYVRQQAETAMPTGAHNLLQHVDPTCRDVISVTCPFGNRFRVHQVGTQYSIDVERGHWHIGASGGCKGLPGPPSWLCGVQYLELDVPRSAIKGISAFWGDLMGGRTSMKAKLPSFDHNIISCTVFTRSGEQWLEFMCRDEGDARLKPWDGHHIALYLHDHTSTYLKCEDKGLVYDPGRFADKGGSLALAQEWKQFRAVHVPPADQKLQLGLKQQLPTADDVSAAEAAGAPIVLPVYSLELEVRSLEHPSCPL